METVRPTKSKRRQNIAVICNQHSTFGWLVATHALSAQTGLVFRAIGVGLGIGIPKYRTDIRYFEIPIPTPTSVFTIPKNTEYRQLNTENAESRFGICKPPGTENFITERVHIHRRNI